MARRRIGCTAAPIPLPLSLALAMAPPPRGVPVSAPVDPRLLFLPVSVQDCTTERFERARVYLRGALEGHGGWA